ncbi:MAG: calcium/proton exchanger [Isosphaeraceae bacterium]|nr:calcium/proton exchanger [Isosphaeraceae bacterium]
MAPRRVNKPEPKDAVRRPSWRDWIDPRRVGWLRLLLVFVPAAVAAHFAGASGSVQFVLASLGIIPLAGLVGEATESLADRLGPGIGGLLNATFGNAAELIIALFALFRGLDGVVKASLTGSIIGNLLLVLGASLLAGGTRHAIQRFNRTAAGVGATLMVLAASGLIVPAIFHGIVGPSAGAAEHRLSLAVAVILMVAYFLSLLFSLVTHKDVFNPKNEYKEAALHEKGAWSMAWAALVLLVATGFVAGMSEILVGAVEETSRALGLTEVFVGVIVVAIVGNAAEHSTAVLMALKNQMDLAVGIALGSALQIALFVAPALVLVSYTRVRPMNLLFSPLEVIAVILAVLLARMVAEDGESNWLEGAMLLLIYAILGMAFYHLPAPQQALSLRT